MLAITHASIFKVLHSALHELFKIMTDHFIPPMPDSIDSLVEGPFVMEREYTYLSQNHKPLQIAR